MEKEILDTIVINVNDLLEEKNYTEIRTILKELDPFDIALILEEYPKNIGLLFRILPKDIASETFIEMSYESQETLLSSFSDHEIKEIVDELYIDDAVDIIEEMPANVVKRILSNADPETRKTINEILHYPEDSAGSIMTTEYVKFEEDFTVEDALKHIRRTGIDKETIYTCYVAKSDRTLLGYVTAKTLLLSDQDSLISEIMETNTIFAYTDDDKENVALEMSKYDLLAIPIVDKENLSKL